MTTTQTIAQHAARKDLTELEYAGSTPTLTLRLNLAMELDAAAQARYEAIWGVAWSPLPMPGLDGCTGLAAGSSPDVTRTCVDTATMDDLGWGDAARRQASRNR